MRRAIVLVVFMNLLGDCGFVPDVSVESAVRVRDIDANGVVSKWSWRSHSFGHGGTQQVLMIAM